MGVVRNLSSLQNTCEDSIEDVLNQIEEQTQSLELDVRRTRKIKHRPNRPCPLGDVQNANPKKGGKRKRQRFENTNFLMTLADPEEAFELSIHDFIAPSISVFCQLHVEQDCNGIWNGFINCADSEAFLQTIILSKRQETSNENKAIALSTSDDNDVDARSSHPANTAIECYRRIDGSLRLALKKKHVPMGALTYLEQELVTFFINRPQSIYHSHIPNSFERLLLHALCQYMDLGALSYNRNGDRWTRVRNNNPTFEHPLMLLSTYLEERKSPH